MLHGIDKPGLTILLPQEDIADARETSGGRSLEVSPLGPQISLSPPSPTNVPRITASLHSDQAEPSAEGINDIQEMGDVHEPLGTGDRRSEASPPYSPRPTSTLGLPNRTAHVEIPRSMGASHFDLEAQIALPNSSFISSLAGGFHPRSHHSTPGANAPANGK
ncbi:hypothetical protein DL93DRAFT_2173195 [Clavulina sp. PMI_390]|nr:hypothetical protein DL93DRAFT_2173195 [Clavulina sp. PMI_390]